MITQADLMTRLRRFLLGELSFEELDRTFVRDLVNNADAMNLSETDDELLASIHEWIEWTAPSPTSEERGYGWHDVSEFREWLRGVLPQPE